MSRYLPSSITADDVRSAIDLYDGGQDHEFGASTFYDLVFNGRRYPPKAIMGIAAELRTGERWFPDDFSGGESSRCFALLRERGFHVEHKPGVSSRWQKADAIESSFGHPEGVVSGQAFPNRRALHDAGVHAPLQAGIHGRAEFGAESIVLSGGYEDDEDLGDVIVYTGQGGQEKGVQVSNQVLARGNAALVTSCNSGRPVRVIRGEGHKSEFSPESGYRYDGLYVVDSYWQERGQSGFRVYRYRLERLESQPLAAQTKVPGTGHASPAPSGKNVAARAESRVVRVVRDTAVSGWVKGLYANQCQVCGEALKVSGGVYSEGAHIRALGAPHAGPDIPQNVICLCPNHHVMFDRGGFAIADDLTLMGLSGALNVHADHSLSIDCIRYHREIHGFLDVVAAVFRDGEKVLIGRRAAHKSDAGGWEFPGGKVEPNESPQEALVREIKEEFGIEVTVGPLLVDYCTAGADLKIRLRTYQVSATSLPTSSTDHDELAWVSPVEGSNYDLAEADLMVAQALAALSA